VSEKEDEMEKGKGSTASVQFLVKFGIFPILLVIFIVFAILGAPKFTNIYNIVNIFRTSAINMVIATGMTLVLLTGGIDISVGSVLAVAGILAVKVSLSSLNWLSIPVALLFGLVIGFLNGYLVAVVKLPPFIATLGSMTSLRGLALILAGDSIINNELNYAWIGNAKFFGIPWMGIIAIFLIAFFHFLTKKTVFGMRIYAVGGNVQAAQFTGIKIKSVLIRVYMLSGLLAAFAGVMISSRNYCANGLMGQGYENDAIAASIVGGTSFTGGKGTILGTLLGALVIAILNNGLTVCGVSYYWQQVARGLVIIGAVILDVYRTRITDNN
jgi:ribose transport system permease protein